MQASCLVLLYYNYYNSFTEKVNQDVSKFLWQQTNIIISKSKVGINMYVYYMYYFVCNNRKHSTVL